MTTFDLSKLIEKQTRWVRARVRYQIKWWDAYDNGHFYDDHYQKVLAERRRLGHDC